jgi:FtsP/CotA-like multicopper oxidase with cupredoxin domain
MKHTRRDVLRLGGVFGVGAAMPFPVLSQTSEMVVLTAQRASLQLAPAEYPETEIWGYDGRMPGPTIRVKQGDRVRRQLVNNLPQATSVHWHGIRIDNAMDGVAGLTQEAVPSGGSFEYDFEAPDAGTYWFHAHNRSVEQVARGLYGALVVEEPTAPDVDRDEVLVLDDWLLDTETAQIVTDFETPMHRSHAGRQGNFVTANGQYGLTLNEKRNDRLRLRLINAANARIFEIALSGLEGWALAYDGMPLLEPEQIEGAFLLGPGQRVDLFVDVTADVGETAHLVRIDDGQGFSQVAFQVAGQGATVSRPTPTALSANPRMDISEIGNARQLRLEMEGGAMGRLDAAVLQGKSMNFSQIVAANQFWAFNGTIGMTDTPLANLARGETASVQINNDTSFPHAMHLHGMHFREILADGSQGPLRDTLLMFSGETRDIAFVADNPGKWLFHCHMLSHAASGMMTWVDVA